MIQVLAHPRAAIQGRERTRRVIRVFRGYRRLFYYSIIPTTPRPFNCEKTISPSMKIHSIVARFLLLLAVGISVESAQAHNEKKKVAGPNGGRIITTVEPNAEFFVTPDRKVQVTFLGKDRKAIAPAGQSVTVTAGERMSPTTLTFTKSGNTLVSNSSLPAGAEVPTVVQIKTTPSAKAVTEKFNVDLAKCGECKLAEYACICGH
jgi:hypothetical protein